MMRNVDFIGIGAQRCATSWIYSCLYEHPEICAPEKEIHFFSRPRYEEKGIEWYKERFTSRCDETKTQGEYSTSYLYHPKAAERIKEHFPETKIIVSLREPATRAFSQYGLHIKVGWLNHTEVSFEKFIRQEETALEQGMYYGQLKRYFDLFPRDQILVVLQEDLDNNKQEFISKIYEFLEVEKSFTPSLLSRQINTDRTPKKLWIDKTMLRVSDFLYKNGFDKIVFAIKKTGLPAKIRGINSTGEERNMTEAVRTELKKHFYDDVKKAGDLVGINLLQKWKYED